MFIWIFACFARTRNIQEFLVVFSFPVNSYPSCTDTDKEIVSDMIYINTVIQHFSK